MIQLTLPLPADYDRRPEHERRVFSWLQRWSHALTLEDVARLLAATRGELEADAGVVMDDARALAGAKGQTLALEPPPADLVVVADPDRAAQVLTELLLNATAFTPPGGAVRVRTIVSEADVTTEVADEGPGIPDAALPRLFEPFYQADGTSTREHGGMGLGLAIAWQLVAKMGGTLFVDSELGRGTRFRFTLPR